ncbi:MAG TPA: glycosyl hydrolase family 18 protein, partial [Gammaproteobacteria bacterium]|nr:glycosyl hydrolase family 18 protein [Gammaproteobacteria bacterium]
AATDDNIIEAAEHHHIKIMPLVTNSLFDTTIVHQFLHDPSAETKALNTLLTNCKAKHFDGLQFDFEMVALSDRDALTAFFKQAADLLHQNKLHISFAVAPVTSNDPQTYFQKKLYQNWEGAYDLKALGEFADFISIMTYDQHASGTTPGTTAGYDWVNQVIINALKVVPAKKISLGIPGYSTHWYLGHEAHHTERTHVNMEALSHADTMKLIEKHHAKLTWDNNAKINYSIFLSDWLNQYVFIEDAKSFAFKYSLTKKYHLRGISYFDLGSEDPHIWEWL